jgi:hypothetical protein
LDKLPEKYSTVTGAASDAQHSDYGTLATPAVLPFHLSHGGCLYLLQNSDYQVAVAVPMVIETGELIASLL